MKLTHKELAESLTEIMQIWLDLDADCDTDENGQEMIKEWLQAQRDEVEEFEKENPNLECISGDGNSVQYEGTAQNFIDAGFDIDINN